MAEKKSGGTTFETIMHDLKAGQYAPVYVLMGEESYYIDRITDYIAEHVLREAERDFNQTVVFGQRWAGGRFGSPLPDDGRTTGCHRERSAEY